MKYALVVLFFIVYGYVLTKWLELAYIGLSKIFIGGE